MSITGNHNVLSCQSQPERVDCKILVSVNSVVFFKNKYKHDLGYHCFDMHFPISLIKFQKYATI